jgi:hypothetical protein
MPKELPNAPAVAIGKLKIAGKDIPQHEPGMKMTPMPLPREERSALIP